MVSGKWSVASKSKSAKASQFRVWNRRVCAGVIYKLRWVVVIEVRRYVTRAGRTVFSEWFAALADRHAKARIRDRVDRLALGNFGDWKSLGGGLNELRIDWGPGYRIYYAMVGLTCVVLLCGGDKSTQAKDIQTAQRLAVEWSEENG